MVLKGFLKNLLQRQAANSFFQKLVGNQLLEKQIQAWAKIWEMSDITIDGDIKAQQGIRFNIFQLNQTYLGKDSRLNIGPKGFTGEKYGGSTYWDTEAYCIPFYMATKDQNVARNLLTYRYNQLDKAIENAGPGYDALIDGVVFQRNEFFRAGWVVEGTPIKTGKLKASNN